LERLSGEVSCPGEIWSFLPLRVAEGFPMSAFMWATVGLFTLRAGAGKYGPNSLQKNISGLDMSGPGRI
jgi:hypothetical protein